MGSKKGMILYYDMRRVFQSLDGETTKKLLLAMLAYSETGESPDDDLGNGSAVFELIRAQIDRDNEKYSRMVEKRSKAGKASAEARAENQHMLTHVNTCQHMSTKATDKDTDKDKDKDKKKKNKEASGLDGLMESFGLSDQVRERVRSFVEVRKAAKAPMTETAVKMMLKKLTEMTTKEEEQIAILEQSIINGWKGIFPIKETQTQSRKPEKASYFRQINQHDHGTDYNALVLKIARGGGD